MKVMFTGFAAIFLIAVAADFLLDEIGFSAAERLSGDAVRLSEEH